MLILLSKGRATGLETLLGGGHLADSTHLLVTILRCACHATLCDTETIIVSRD
jgi:hypothetical protein